MKTTIIVPCYNEYKRAPSFIPHLIRNTKDEIILVNDGSTDRTKDLLINCAMIDTKRVKVVSYDINHGKGYAIKQGIIHATGDKIIFIDADGSIQPDQIPNMISLLDEYDVVCGDRLHGKRKTPLLRKMSSFGFNSLCSLIMGYSYRDNLCGFKGFRRDVAIELFKDLKEERWLFDVELFVKIENKFSLKMMPIKWEHRDGSKIKLWDPIIWFFRLLKLRKEI
jgi:glycosyltransferase involved in cell wall biosynthesis